MGLEYDHIGLCVSDLPRAVEFYRDILGMERVGRHILSDNKTHQAAYHIGNLILILFHRPDFKPADPRIHQGLDHLALTMDGKMFMDVLGKLKARDMVLRGPYHNSGAFGMGVATYFYDPDYNQIEIKTYDPDVLARFTEEDPGPTTNRHMA